MNVLLLVAPGTEEMEAVIIIDTLRRAEWSVTVAGVQEGVIEASRGVKLVPDVLLNQVDFDAFDGLVLPGGYGGTMIFCEDVNVQNAIQTFHQNKRWIGAICAAPLALYAAGILEGKKFTCYPGVEENLPQNFQRLEDLVVVDGRLITSQGPGSAFDFALKLIEIGSGEAIANLVRKQLLL